MQIGILVALLFFIRGFIRRQDLRVWHTLGWSKVALLASAWFFGGGMESPHYWLRLFIELAAFYAILLPNRTALAVYEASTILVTLVAYLFLELDLIAGTNVVYDNYEQVMYGIMVAQLLGCAISVAKHLWCSVTDFAQHMCRSYFTRKSDQGV